MTTIQANYTYLNKEAFRFNQNIEYVDCMNIPYTSGGSASSFQNCYNLKAVNNFNGSTLNWTFLNCYNLKAVSPITDNISEMTGAFKWCYNLKSIQRVPNSVTNLSQTFYLCYNLLYVPDIPNSITNMYQTFYGCYNLKKAPAISNSVTNVYQTFANCYNITSFTQDIPNSVINFSAFLYNCYRLRNASFNIPNSVTSINRTFYNCGNLTNIPNYLPNSITDMTLAFWNCKLLKNIPTIPDSVITLDRAFMSCYNITTISNIPSYTNNMNATFQSCSNLTGNIYIESENVEIATNCFYNTTLEKNVYIPFKNNGIYTKTYNSFYPIYGRKQINGTIVGNLVNNDGVISGFSESKGIVLSKTITNTFNSFEIRMKIITGSDIINNQIFFCTTENPRCPIALNVNQGKFCIYLASNTSTWDIAENLLGSYSVQANKTYYIKFIYDGTRYLLSYSEDDTLYTPDIPVNTSTKIASFTPTIGWWGIDGTHGDGSFFKGSIDLDYCYININNELWWEGLDYVNGVHLLDINHESQTEVDVTDYTYTENLDGITITKYVGNGTVLVAPHLEEVE